MVFEGEGGEEEDVLGEYIGERNLCKERHGSGWAYLPNGDVYQGQYRRGQRHGQGLYVFKNGARYVGAYRCGLRRGTGTMRYPDGSTYSGEWRKDLRHGHGTYTYPNGDTYEGSWFKNQRHGIGRYTYAEAGCVFHGTWKEGVREGAAEVIFRRHRFHGTWYGEDPMGPAAYTFACKNMALGYVQLEANSVVKNAADAADGRKPEDVKSAGGDGKSKSSDATVLRNEPNRPRTCEPIWKVQHIDGYEFSRLPPEPMPLPLGDSEEEECEVTPVMSEDEFIYFAPNDEEGQGEEEIDDEHVDEEEMIGDE